MLNFLSEILPFKIMRIPPEPGPPVVTRETRAKNWFYFGSNGDGHFALLNSLLTAKLKKEATTRALDDENRFVPTRILFLDGSDRTFLTDFCDIFAADRRAEWDYRESSARANRIKLFTTPEIEDEDFFRHAAATLADFIPAPDAIVRPHLIVLHRIISDRRSDRHRLHEWLAVIKTYLAAPGIAVWLSEHNWQDVQWLGEDLTLTVSSTRLCVAPEITTRFTDHRIDLSGDRLESLTIHSQTGNHVFHPKNDYETIGKFIEV